MCVCVYVLLTNCSTSGDRVNPDKVHTIKLTKKNGRRKTWVNKGPLSHNVPHTVPHSVGEGHLGVDQGWYKRDSALLKQHCTSERQSL